MRGASVKFFRNAGTNSFADGVPYSGGYDTVVDGVCQVCHLNTSFFSRSGFLESKDHGSHPARVGQDCERVPPA